MKAKYLFPALAVFALASCDDDWYAKEHFGSDKDLWQATQVNAHEFNLSAADYQTLAKNATNRQKALDAAADSSVLRELEKVGEKGAFLGNITPTDYLPAIFPSLCGGNSAYYSMSEGSTIKVIYQQIYDVTVKEEAFIPATGSVEPGYYLLAVEGQEQVLAHQNNAATGQTYAYGRLSLSGNEARGLVPITRLNDNAVKKDAASESYRYELSDAGEGTFFLSGPTGEYLYSDGEHQSFQFTEDMGDLDDQTFARWIVTMQADGTVEIKNEGSQQVILFDPGYKNAQLYNAEQQAAATDISSIVLYTLGQFDAVVDGEPQEEEANFTLENEEGKLVWNAKGDYLNQALTGMTGTTVADEIFAATGWTVKANGSIGELTYVWRLDAIYGLRASAYANRVYTPTDVYAISPAMNMKKAVEPEFRFEEAQKYCGTPIENFLQVWVSTDYDGGDVTSATWANVTDRLQGTRPDGSSWDFVPIRLSLKEFAGKENVRVAFRYISDDVSAATWEVKNIRCAEANAFEE